MIRIIRMHAGCMVVQATGDEAELTQLAKTRGWTKSTNSALDLTPATGRSTACRAGRMICRAPRLLGIIPGEPAKQGLQAVLPSDRNRKVTTVWWFCRGQAGHSLGHSTCRNATGQNRTQWTTTLT
jgi:hypothetical protein